jgi:amidophosphoribosyltransferase
VAVFGVWAPARTSPSSPTSGSTPCSTEARSPAGIAVGNGRQILVYKDMGLVSQSSTSHARSAARSRCDRPTRATRRPARASGAQRAADLRSHVVGRLDRRSATRNLTNSGDLAQAGRRAGSRSRPARTSPPTPRRRRATPTWSPHCWPPTPIGPLEQAAAVILLATDARGLLVRVHGRGHVVRRPRPAGHPPSRPGSARARLGRSPRRRRPSTSSAPRSCARWSRRADRHRRDGLAQPRSPSAGAKGCLFEFVYLAGPAPRSGPGVHSRPGRDRPDGSLA